MSSPIQQHPGPTSFEQTGQCLRHPRPGRCRQPHQHWHRGRSSGRHRSPFVRVSSFLISPTRPAILRTSMSVQLFQYQSPLPAKTDTLVSRSWALGVWPNGHAMLDNAIAMKATPTTMIRIGFHHLPQSLVSWMHPDIIEISVSSSVSYSSSHTIMYSPAAGLRLTGSGGLDFVVCAMIDGRPRWLPFPRCPAPLDDWRPEDPGSSRAESLRPRRPRRSFSRRPSSVGVRLKATPPCSG